MDALKLYFKDKYTSTELVEHIDISMDDLLWILTDWLEEHTEDFQKDYEVIFNMGDID
jgi:hypothetical protein